MKLYLSKRNLYLGPLNFFFLKYIPMYAQGKLYTLTLPNFLFLRPWVYYRLENMENLYFNTKNVNSLNQIVLKPLSY